MKSLHKSLSLFTRSLALLGLLALPQMVAAGGAQALTTETLSLNAGETHVIDNLSPSATPAIKVINNPHALVVHHESPGKLVLMGTEEGKWQISAKLKDGGDVTYEVTVHALKDWSNVLKPGKAPPAMNGGSSVAEASTGAGSASAPLDPGTGPVAGLKGGSRPVVAGSTLGKPAVPSAPAAPPADPVRAVAPVPDPSMAPSQTASNQLKTGVFKSDPSVVATGQTYSTDGVISSGGTHFLPADGISIMTGTSRVFDFTKRMRRVSIADTEIADVQVMSPYQLNLVGHKPGFTTLAVWTTQGNYEERQVRVDPGGKQQVMLHCMVAQLDRNKIENQGMNIAAGLASAGVTVFGMPGAVGTPFSPTIPVMGQSIFGPVSMQQQATMPVGGQLLPFLLSQNVTYGMATQNGQWATNTFFQFLENHGLGKILAQPNLLANSGEKAKFLSGGQIPIVIAQALNTSIVFKEFGTKVIFLPTVVGLNDIELLVQPEVSEPDYAHGVQMFGFNIPAFVTRRAETLVRLRDGQTLIIAGLILRERHETIQKVPYLGDIPVAGGLFRNTAWENNETDLVMSVTPEIVRPLPAGAQVYTPPASRGGLTSEEIRTGRPSSPDAGRPRF